MFLTKNSKGIIAIQLIAISVLALASTDLYISSLTLITKYFKTTDNVVQLTMSFNLLGFSILQIVAGALSDRFGRRPVLIMGLILFLIASVICAYSFNITVLIIGRFLQGIGASIMPLLALAVAKDIFAERECVKFLSIQASILAMIPAIVPIFGGYIAVYFGWQSNFILLSLMIFALLLSTLFLFSETNRNKHSISIKKIALSVKLLLKDSAFIRNSLISALVLSGLIMFITSAPIAFVNIFNLKVQHYAFYYAVLVIAQILGTVFTRRLVYYIKVNRILKVGITILLAGAMICLIGASYVNLYIFCIGVFVYMFGMDSVFSPTATLAMQNKTSAANGVASGLFGTVEMLAGSLVAFILAFVYNDSLVTLGVMLLSISLLTCFIFFKPVKQIVTI